MNQKKKNEKKLMRILLVLMFIFLVSGNVMQVFANTQYSEEMLTDLASKEMKLLNVLKVELALVIIYICVFIKIECGSKNKRERVEIDEMQKYKD